MMSWREQAQSQRESTTLSIRSSFHDSSNFSRVLLTDLTRTKRRCPKVERALLQTSFPRRYWSAHWAVWRHGECREIPVRVAYFMNNMPIIRAAKRIRRRAFPLCTFAVVSGRKQCAGKFRRPGDGNWGYEKQWKDKWRNSDRRWTGKRLYNESGWWRRWR